MARKASAKKSAKAKAGKTSGKRASAKLAPVSNQTVEDALASVLIAQKQLNAILARDANTRAEVASLVGDLRGDIATAVKDHHLNKHAFALLKKLKSIEPPQKRAIIWRTLIAYMQMTGLMKQIEDVLELPLEGGSDEPAQEDAEGADKTEKKPRPGPAFGDSVKKIAETAGATTSGE